MNPNHDISQYSDEELYQILDLHRPTDRELEAKIHQLLDTYEGNDDVMYRFVYRIYEHFFDVGGGEGQGGVVESFTNGPTGNVSEVEVDVSGTGAGTGGAGTSGERDAGTDRYLNMIQPDPDKQNVSRQTLLNYTPGAINPLLKETIQRVIYIDSQNRDTNVFPYSTDYSITLSEPLIDVVSMKLYSVQIPYTWFVIDSRYGSNFFYIKGNQIAITDAYHDMKVEIRAGNYSSDDLVTAVQTNFSAMMLDHPDIQFGQTNLSYNSLYGHVTFALEMKNIYHENAYALHFPAVSIPTVPQYIFYTDVIAPYINMTYFSLNVSPFILPDLIDVSKSYHSLSSLVADISANIYTNIVSRPLISLIGSVFTTTNAADISNIIALVSDSVSNTLIQQIASFNVDQLLFLTDLSDTQLNTFFNLTYAQQQDVSQSTIGSADFLAAADVSDSLLQHRYYLFDSSFSFSQHQFTDVSNLDVGHADWLPPVPSTMASHTHLGAFFDVTNYLDAITGIRDGFPGLMHLYNDVQLNLYERFHHNELYGLSTIADASLSLLGTAAFPYTPLLYLLNDMDQGHLYSGDLALISDMCFNALLRFDRDISASGLDYDTWTHVFDIDNLSTFYPDVSGMNASQYQYLASLSDASLAFLSAMTFTGAQLGVLGKFHPAYKMDYLFQLSQMDIALMNPTQTVQIDASRYNDRQYNFYINNPGLTIDDIQVISSIQLADLALLMRVSDDISLGWVYGSGGGDFFLDFDGLVLPNDTYANVQMRSQELYARGLYNDVGTGTFDYGLIQTYQITSPQWHELYALRTVDVSYSTQFLPTLAQTPSYYIDTLAAWSFAQIRAATQLNDVQLLTLSQLDPSHVQLMASLDPTPLSWVFDLSAAQLSDLSLNLASIQNVSQVSYLIQPVFAPPDVDTFIAAMIPLARLRLTRAQFLAIRIVLYSYLHETANRASALQRLHSLIQYMSSWDDAQLREWSVIALLQLTSPQLVEVANMIQRTKTVDITSIITYGKAKLESIYTILTENTRQRNLMRFVRYAEYYSIYSSYLQGNPISIVSYDASMDFVVNLPSPPSKFVTQPDYYGYKMQEWVASIQRQIQAQPMVAASTVVIDPSLTGLQWNMQTHSGIQDRSFYMMSFFDPLYYSETSLRLHPDTLVWDSSGGSSNIWYKYLKLPYPSEVLFSNRQFVSLPGGEYVILSKTKEVDVSGNFTIVPTLVEIKESNSFVNYTIPKLLGFDADVYQLNQYVSNVFIGSAYNQRQVYRDVVPDASFSLRVDMYVPDIHDANPVLPIDFVNYTYTDVCGVGMGGMASGSSGTSGSSGSGWSIGSDASHHLMVSLGLYYDISMTDYSLSDVIEGLNASIRFAGVFTEDSRVWIVDASGDQDVPAVGRQVLLRDSGIYYYRIVLKYERKKVFQYLRNDANLKYALRWVDPLWTHTAGFHFAQAQYEFSNVVSENAPIRSEIAFQEPLTVDFRCVTPGYRLPTNDVSFSIAPPGSAGYTYLEFFDIIRRSVTPYTSWGLTVDVSNTQPDFFASMQFMIRHVVPGSYVVGGVGVGTGVVPNFHLDFSKSIFATFSDSSAVWSFDSSGNQFVFDVHKVPGVFVLGSNNTFHVRCNATAYQTMDSSATYTLPRVNSTDSPYYKGSDIYTITDLVQTVNTLFNNDIVVGVQDLSRNISLYGSTMSYDPNRQQITLQLTVKSVLTNLDYQISFLDGSGGGGSAGGGGAWSQYLGLDVSYVLGTSTVQGTIPALDKNLMLTLENNFFTLKPVWDPHGGVYIPATTDPFIQVADYNDIVISLARLTVGKYYTINEIVNEINYQFDHYTNSYGNVLHGSSVVVQNAHTTFRFNVNTTYTTKDYILDFFDPISFVSCAYGNDSYQLQTKWDTTLGWILGYRSSATYELLVPDGQASASGIRYYPHSQNQYTYDVSTNRVTLRSDTCVSTQIYNHCLLSLDDYTTSRINDGLVTIHQNSQDVPLLSYTDRTRIKCLPGSQTTNFTQFLDNQYYDVTGGGGAASGGGSESGGALTLKQQYSKNAILYQKYHQLQQNPYQVTTGPNMQDIFALIPLRTGGLKVGQSYVEFGGTLQNQDRAYFGPVNLRRLTVRLLTDKGTVLNLNNANWSFGMVVQQLYTSNNKK